MIVEPSGSQSGGQNTQKKSEVTDRTGRRNKQISALRNDVVRHTQPQTYNVQFLILLFLKCYEISRSLDSDITHYLMMRMNVRFRSRFMLMSDLVNMYLLILAPPLHD